MIVCTYTFAITIVVYLVLELPLKRLEDNFIFKKFMVKNYSERRLAKKLSCGSKAK